MSNVNDPNAVGVAFGLAKGRRIPRNFSLSQEAHDYLNRIMELQQTDNASRVLDTLICFYGPHTIRNLERSNQIA